MHKVKLNVESEVWTWKNFKIEKHNAKKVQNNDKIKVSLRTESNDIDGYQKSTLAANDYDDFILNTVEMRIPYCIKMFASCFLWKIDRYD
ncbi:eukaryotic translation initiation factor 3 subunit J-like [Anastrepha ludens]|uniref:eukaryotic translation initiation factor 3 subunit J-like n=1 Tax=Anastrepha ludens TaxID=28586 RepID=UPI0023B14153|nr:eukaryotic translation initiation factor 3 subunit J-like [Anastrepha ludens]